MARRRNLRGGEAARSIEIPGNEMPAGALALRTYAARQQLPHIRGSRSTLRPVRRSPAPLPLPALIFRW